MYAPGEKMKTVLSKDIRMRWTRAIEFPSCHTIDIANYFDFNTAPPKQIFFYFNKVKNLGVSLYVVDKIKALKRPLKVRSPFKNKNKIKVMSF